LSIGFEELVERRRHLELNQFPGLHHESSKHLAECAVYLGRTRISFLWAKLTPELLESAKRFKPGRANLTGHAWFKSDVVSECV